VDTFVTIQNRHTGEILRLSRVRDAQGQIVLKLDGSLPPGTSGPPLHVHFHEREEGTVRAGTLGAHVGKEKIVVRTGGTAAFAAGSLHKWWNAGDDVLEFSGYAIPAVDLDGFLQGFDGGKPRTVATVDHLSGAPAVSPDDRRKPSSPPRRRDAEEDAENKRVPGVCGV